MALFDPVLQFERNFSTNVHSICACLVGNTVARYLRHQVLAVAHVTIIESCAGVVKESKIVARAEALGCVGIHVVVMPIPLASKITLEPSSCVDKEVVVGMVIAGTIYECSCERVERSCV